LMRKHGPSLEEVIAFSESGGARLSEPESGGERIAE